MSARANYARPCKLLAGSFGRCSPTWKRQAPGVRREAPGTAKVRPERTDDNGVRGRLEMLKDGVSVEIGQLHKTNALLIATQFAANHDCEFDASDAVAAIIVRVEQSITTLDRLCLEASQ
jgi:hypothetical protein